MTNIDSINYDKLIQNSLKSVVRDALSIFQQQGPVGEHHFFITFKTNTNGVNIPNKLLSQYPEEMTIILQHQFEGLEVTKNGFAVNLSFGGVPERLEIDFDSVVSFADPHAKFGLSFESTEANTGKAEAKSTKPAAEVVSIDAFRKVKK